jgi:hypothetical protein
MVILVFEERMVILVCEERMVILVCEERQHDLDVHCLSETMHACIQ